MKTDTATTQSGRGLAPAPCSAWFERGWMLAAASTYLGARRMSYAAFRQALYSGDKRHPKLAVMRPGDSGCRASISPRGYSAREQFARAWEFFMSWFIHDQGYQLLLYLPTKGEAICGNALAGGQFHRWAKALASRGPNAKVQGTAD